MISQRARGLQKMLLISQSLLAVALLAVAALITFTVITSAAWEHLERYPVYALLVVAGLAIEVAKRRGFEASGSFVARSLAEHHRQALRQVAYAIGALLCYLVVFKDQYISRTFMLGYFPALYVGLVVTNRYLPRLIARRVFAGVREERCVIIGTPERAERLRAWVQRKEAYGIRTIGLLTDTAAAAPSENAFPRLGSPSDLVAVAEAHGLTQVIVAGLPENLPAHRQLVATAERLGLRLLVQSNLEEVLTHPVIDVEDEGMRLITLRSEPLENPMNRGIKRVLDLAVAIPMVVLVLPPVAVAVWLLQRLQSPGPLFYRQQRAGALNRRFETLKFRTMHPADPGVATTRVYPGGALLRRFSIDEIPQFLSVLRGHLSVTGPRPQALASGPEGELHRSSKQLPAFVRPGLTGLAEVRGQRGDAQSAEAQARRAESDNSYLENWRLGLDLAIMLRRLWQLLSPDRSAS